MLRAELRPDGRFEIHGLGEAIHVVSFDKAVHLASWIRDLSISEEVKRAERRAYIARCECGQVVAATVIEPRRKAEIARMIAEWVRDGLTIEQVGIPLARDQFGMCECEEGNR